MANWYDDDDTQIEDTDLVKRLRKEIKDRDRNLAEIRTQLTELSGFKRGRDVEGVLASLGVTNPKVARLVPESVEADKEHLARWLEDFADVLPVSKKETPEAAPEAPAPPADEQGAGAGVVGAPSMSPEFMAAFQRMQAGQDSSTPVPVDRDGNSMKFLNDLRDSAKSLDDVMTAFKMSGGPTP